MGKGAPPPLSATTPLLEGQAVSSPSAPLVEGCSPVETPAVDLNQPGTPEHVISKTQYRQLQALYFLAGLSASTWGRFSTIYYLTKGINAAQIGVIEGSMVVTKLFSGMLWGVVADWIRSQKRVALGTRLCSTTILMLFAFPAVAKGFYRILIISIATCFFSSAGVLDSYALDMLGKDKAKYGRIRLFMAASWGGGAALMGIATDQLHSFTPNFLAFLVFGLASITFMACVIPDRNHLEKKMKGAKLEFRKLVVLCKPPVLLFLLEVTVMGVGLGVVERLLFIFLQNDLGANTTLCGLVVLVTVLLELPLFFYSDRIHKAIGHDGMFITAMVAYVVRVVGYTYLTPSTKYYIFVCELTHGLTISLAWVATVNYARNIAPPELRTTLFTIVSLFSQCVGTGGGAVLGGWIFEHKGAVFLYRGAAAMVGSCLVLHVFLVVLFKACGWTLHPVGTDAGKPEPEVVKVGDEEGGQPVTEGSIQ